MPNDDELSPTERQAMRRLATDAPTDRLAEERTVRRLRAEGLVGATSRARGWTSRWRIAIAVAGPAAGFAAGLIVGLGVHARPEQSLSNAAAPNARAIATAPPPTRGAQSVVIEF